MAGLFASISRWNQRRAQLRREKQEREADLSQALDALVDAADPLIASIMGYRRRLRHPVTHAIKYIDDAVSCIPGPLKISREIWKSDPVVNSFFVKEGDMRALLRRVSAGSRFLREYSAGGVFALLTMTRSDRTVFSTQKTGDLVKRDVPRTSVTFVKHRLIAPAASEDETRDELRLQGLLVLAQAAREGIDRAEMDQEELEKFKNMLEVKIRSLGGHRGSEVFEHHDGSSRELEIARLKRDLAQVENDLREAKQEHYGREDHLRKLIKVLAQPQNFFRAEVENITLNEFCMISDGTVGETCHLISVSEFTMGEEFKRAAVVVQFDPAAL